MGRLCYSNSKVFKEFARLLVAAQKIILWVIAKLQVYFAHASRFGSWNLQTMLQKEKEALVNLAPQSMCEVRCSWYSKLAHPPLSSEQRELSQE